MELYSIISGALLVLIILQTVRADIPGCHFLETVNLSSSQRLQNGSYIYKDLVVPVHLTGEYDYITTEWGYNDTVKSHLRGCVCQLKPCIWFCCRFKDWVPSNGECTDGLMEELTAINPYLNVTLGNGSVVKRNLLEDFIVLRDRMQIQDFWKEAKYTLFQNGSVLLRRYINETMEFRGYDCLHPNQFRAGNTESLVAAMHMHSYSYSRWEYWENTRRPGENELVCLSEFFLVLTMAVYLYVKKLRNLHGKCFICHMVATFICFSYRWLNTVTLPSQLCVLNGYFFYLFILAKFTWLFALSHQLWRGLTSANRAASEYSFGAYSIFAWGMPAILMGLLYLIDQIWDSDPNKLKWITGIGWEDCDSMDGHESTLNILFLYPCLTLISLNAFLFVLTAINIIKVKLSLTYSSGQEERTRNLNSSIQMFKMFLRLFVVMDVQWSVIMFFILANWYLLELIFAYSYYCIGIIIFVLFILKRSTIRLLMESIRNGRQ